MAQVELNDVAKHYGGVAAIEHATLLVREGEFFSLLGPSGSGKTTLLRLVAGFFRPDSGTIRIGRAIVNDTPPHKRNIGMVFQNYALFPHRTVSENVAFGLEMRGVKGAELRRRVGEALEMVQLTGRGTAYPRQLSGGQQQRVAIARSIAMRPALLLLDEPLSALDRKLRADMQVELRALQQTLGITALYVTHDQEEALAMSDRIAIVNQGRIAQMGTGEDLYERPADSFVANFLGNANLIDVVVRRSSPDSAVRIGSEAVAAELPANIPDGAAKLALRPERLILRGAGAARPAGYVGLPSTVTSFVYLGGDVRAVVQTRSGHALTSRMTQRECAEAGSIRQGCEVDVLWRPEEAIFVAR